jgi:hypothetical protein
MWTQSDFLLGQVLRFPCGTETALKVAFHPNLINHPTYYAKPTERQNMPLQDQSPITFDPW